MLKEGFTKGTATMVGATNDFSGSTLEDQHAIFLYNLRPTEPNSKCGSTLTLGYNGQNHQLDVAPACDAAKTMPGELISVCVTDKDSSSNGIPSVVGDVILKNQLLIIDQSECGNCNYSRPFCHQQHLREFFKI